MVLNDYSSNEQRLHLSLFLFFFVLILLLQMKLYVSHYFSVLNAEGMVLITLKFLTVKYVKFYCRDVSSFHFGELGTKL